MKEEAGETNRGETLRQWRISVTLQMGFPYEQGHSSRSEWKDVEVSTALRGLSSSHAGKKRYCGAELIGLSGHSVWTWCMVCCRQEAWQCV